MQRRARFCSDQQIYTGQPERTDRNEFLADDAACRKSNWPGYRSKLLVMFTWRLGAATTTSAHRAVV